MCGVHNCNTGTNGRIVSGLPEIREHGIDELEGLVYLLADPGAGQDEFAGDEDEKHDLGFHHAIDEAREKLGFV